MAILRDVQKLSDDVRGLTDSVSRHEEQISGKRGLIAANEALVEELRGIKRALYAVAGGIVVSAVGFGYGALRLVG